MRTDKRTPSQMRPVEIVIGVWDTHLLDEHPDEYWTAKAQLPDLLAEYQTQND